MEGISKKLAYDPSIKEPPHSIIQSSAAATLPLYAYNAVLNEIISAGFIVDKFYTILHSIGKARELIILPEGLPSLILTTIILDDLKAPLVSALHQVENKRSSVIYDNLTFQTHQGEVRTLKMATYPIYDMTHEVSYFWIRFDPIETTMEKETALVLSHHNGDVNRDEMIILLEKELSKTKTMLQASFENMETIHEEMQSSNEELMAANEELQSTNEELQSVNEELYTVNSEYSKKIEELIQIKADIDNLICSAEVSAVILNNKFEIRMFTPSSAKVFNLLERDIGRSLKNFRHNLNIESLMEKMADVLNTNKAHEYEITDSHNHWYLLRIRPYYLPHQKVNSGVVLTLTDIHELKTLQQKQQRSEEELRLALKMGVIGVWHWNISDHTFHCDETIKNILGVSMLFQFDRFKDFMDSIHVNDKKRVEEAFKRVLSQKESFEQDFRIIHPDGKIRYMACCANLYHDTLLNQDHVTGICWDVTERHWLETEIINSKHLNLELDAITDGWWDFNLVTQQIYLSPLFKKTLGYKDHELSNSMENYEQLLLPGTRKAMHAELEKHKMNNNDSPLIQELSMQHKDGHTVWIVSHLKGIKNKRGKWIRMIGTQTDITALKIAEDQLKQHAYKDALTQLANQMVFLTALPRALARAKRNQNILAILYVDLNNFKLINDTKGHSVGDGVLRETANRLLAISREVDLVARLGGDEFGILLEDISTLKEVHSIIKRYILAFSNPLKINRADLLVTFSIGVALYPGDGETPEALLQRADENMYAAKKKGENQYIISPIVGPTT
ncbi:MAG: hypothetical protein A3F17_08825 [Gammaproteobacteria bacterium RIFCSPHIGHO2_12_FULL_41_15]|nr:MAG: hypothetical protein A3F17_08825 [Gammaproteobacteria bacterium RIFCSPHIGHO2_12_FULL_41_15]